MKIFGIVCRKKKKAILQQNDKELRQELKEQQLSDWLNTTKTKPKDKVLYNEKSQFYCAIT